jgi:ubiquinone/menaquinone biosynthesis C-methylase UbiE
MIWFIALIILLAAVALAYWLLIPTEGVFLGRRMVVWLYDLTAHRYDRIKEFNPDDERLLVTNPILQAVAGIRQPHILDVATGTGRVPHDLLRSPDFAGNVVGIDASRRMLSHAAHKLDTDGERAGLVLGNAERLPFPAERFHIVVCLEALEFFTAREAAIREMFRVLRPGGRLFITRRCGVEGKMFLHRYQTAAEFEDCLRALGAGDVHSFHWEVGYDLVIASKDRPHNEHGQFGLLATGNRDA